MCDHSPSDVLRKIRQNDLTEGLEHIQNQDRDILWSSNSNINVHW